MNTALVERSLETRDREKSRRAWLYERIGSLTVGVYFCNSKNYYFQVLLT